jgi:hypothetical protein
MSRRLVLAIVCAASTAHADDAVSTSVAPPDMSDQGVGASIGVAAGGHVTAGGLRLAGHYLYKLSDQDYFDGVASFTYGGGSAQCFRDRMNAFVCDHGLADGGTVEVGANVRRFFGGRDQFWPFARAGIGIAIVRFQDDSVTGFAVPLHIGGGVRAEVSDGVAIVGEGALDLGFGIFNHSLGLEPQVGLAITAGAEFRL